MNGLPIRGFREGGLRVSGWREKTEGTSPEGLGQECQALVEGSETAFPLEALREPGSVDWAHVGRQGK